MSGKVYAFMSATAIRHDDDSESHSERNGWIDQEWSMTVLHDSRNDASPLVNEWETDTEELTEAVRDVLGDGSLWEDNGDGTFYAKDSRADDGWDITYAVHFFVKDYRFGQWQEIDWHPETDGGISLSENGE